jgi:outer membrane protein assembly factor BamE (lipoprotein component of BamABCDE complex)
MNKTRTAFIVVAILLTAGFGYLFVGMESYCVLYPSIDTRYASGFTESNFEKVQVGMTKDEVVSLLGDPLGGISVRSRSRWSYTQDGNCRWADWAWFGREVVFRDDRVVEKVSCIYYD